MSEIKTPLIKFPDQSGDDCYLIQAKHTLADIVRHLLTETDEAEILQLLERERK